MTTDRFQTVKEEVAGFIRVGEVTVRRWIKGGQLRAIGVGRGWRIAVIDLDRFLESHATAPPPRRPGALQGGPYDLNRNS